MAGDETEPMKHIIVGTAGHIDHGKTALVKALTGIDADRLKEEKQRGITIDIGFADLALGEYQFGFVDVPGHERFVKNMLAGAHGLDLVMLVVAADESVMPQTREHFDICRLLRVKGGLVILTKTDLVDGEMVELVRAEVEDFVKGSFLEGAPVVAVSSRTGEGIEELKSALANLASGIESKPARSLARLPIDRSFSIKGFGTVVTGTLVAGEIKVGDDVEVLPGGQRARVRNVQIHGRDSGRAFAGQRTAVNLQGLNVEEAQRGAVLAPVGRLRPTSMIDARLEVLASAARPLNQRARVRFHHGTAEVLARILILTGGRSDVSASSSIGQSRDELVKPDQQGLQPGESAFVQVRLETPVTALPGDRFIIRSYSPQVTIGGGVVIDALPEKHRIRDLNAPDRLRQVEAADPKGRLVLFVEMSGTRGMSFSDLAARTGATDDQLAATVSELSGAGRVIEVVGTNHLLISTRAFRKAADRVIAILKSHHEGEPLSLGLSREEVRERVFGNADPDIFRALVSRLSGEGTIAAERETLRLAAHRPALTGEDATLKEKLEATIKAAGLQAGTLEEAAAASNVPLELARKLSNLLNAEQRILRVGELTYHKDVIEDLKQRVRARKAIDPRMDVAVFKDITGGLTRKYAIPLLEFLDRERVTRRVGNEREIL
jgi:selenocysteine-specific elongation factor